MAHVELRWWAKLALVLYVFAAMPYCAGGAFVRWVGPCPAFSSSMQCEWSAAWEFWLFPGSQIATIAVGMILFLGLRRWAGRPHSRLAR